IGRTFVRRSRGRRVRVSGCWHLRDWGVGVVSLGLAADAGVYVLSDVVARLARCFVGRPRTRCTASYAWLLRQVAGCPGRPGYWPTTIAETAVRQKLFDKEGITAELTIYRGGAETFEAMAAGAADVILDATSLAAAGRKKGVMSKVVANAAMGYYGWQLMVLE